jgi:hypothetical protein
MDVVAVLTKVVQEQERLIDEQRKTVIALAKRVEMLEKKQ